jgi:ComF family protein
MGLQTVLASLLYPSACPVCRTVRSDHGTVPLCPACLGRAEPDAPATCATWRYTGVVADAVRQFKYQRRWRLGAWLTDGMEGFVRRWMPMDDIDVVVPLPSHWLRRRLRGFDAPDALARALARRLDKPCDPRALRRPRWTASQTRLSWPQRLRNVRGAFAARRSRVAGRAVLLVDDVLTSGATARAASRALRRAGARAVYVITAARTPAS